MSSIVARPIALWRIAAIAAVALIATTGLAQGLTPAASAAPPAPAPAPAPNASFAWTGAALTIDNGTAGVPDVGDEVTYTFTVTASATAPANIVSFELLSLEWSASQYGLAIAPGTSQSFSVKVEVVDSMLNVLGSGPSLFGASAWYRLAGQMLPRNTTIAAPPVLYTAPTPITVTTGFAMTEVYGFEANKLVEGDHVHYVTHVTNTSSANLKLTGTGYATPSSPVNLAPGASKDFIGTDVGVTYADMVAGGVSFADASVSWRAGSMSGTVAAPVGTAPTEAIDATVDAAATFTVHSAVDGSTVPLGAAAAGDMIDVKFDATNNGNVTLNYIGLALNPWIAGVTTSANDASLLTPWSALPNGVWKPKDINSAKGAFTRYTLTAADISLGYVDVGADIAAAPSRALYDASPSSYTTRVDERVFLRNFTTKANLKFTDAQLNDTNGDGIGQADETVTYRVRLANNADQSLVIDNAGDAVGSNVVSPIGGKFTGATVVVDDVIAKHWTYTITADDVARGTIDAGVAVGYHGDADGAANSRTAWADTIPTGVYVAPASTLDTAATYTDTNADGFPSIGELVHVTVTVTNTGSYPLTGLTVTDAAGSDVTGLLPAFAATIAGGGSDAQSFDYVLTAADFARGSLGYSTEMTADGLPTTASSTSVNLTDITFQAYSTDLDDVAAGGISVCEANGTPTDTITLLSKIVVTPGESCNYAGLSYGYRVVAYSTPMLLGTSTFTVTVPAALHVGPHRLALYAPNGTLVGWKDVTAKDPIGFAAPANGANLAATGAEGDEIAGLGGDALLLVLLGTAFIVADSRRRKHSAR